MFQLRFRQQSVYVPHLDRDLNPPQIDFQWNLQ